MGALVVAWVGKASARTIRPFRDNGVTHASTRICSLPWSFPIGSLLARAGGFLLKVLPARATGSIRFAGGQHEGA